MEPLVVIGDAAWEGGLPVVGLCAGAGRALPVDVAAVLAGARRYTHVGIENRICGVAGGRLGRAVRPTVANRHVQLSGLTGFHRSAL